MLPILSKALKATRNLATLGESIFFEAVEAFPTKIKWSAALTTLPPHKFGALLQSQAGKIKKQASVMNELKEVNNEIAATQDINETVKQLKSEFQDLRSSASSLTQMNKLKLGVLNTYMAVGYLSPNPDVRAKVKTILHALVPTLSSSVTKYGVGGAPGSSVPVLQRTKQRGMAAQKVAAESEGYDKTEKFMEWLLAEVCK